jgi:hypothetical protein
MMKGDKRDIDFVVLGAALLAILLVLAALAAR